ncbi:MAG: ABC transporter substrate-binding protein [Comamonadaceae bacterium]|nr:ABC transporter substrate-binding protein [Comamonadaceae bacterium]
MQSYRSQFAQELSAGGIDGLIATLVERNKAAAPRAERLRMQAAALPPRRCDAARTAAAAAEHAAGASPRRQRLRIDASRAGRPSTPRRSRCCCRRGAWRRRAGRALRRRAARRPSCVELARLYGVEELLLAGAVRPPRRPPT